MLVVPAAGWALPFSELAGGCLCLGFFLRQHAVVLLQALNMKIGVGLQEMPQLLIIFLISLVFHLNYHVAEVCLLGEQVLDEAYFVLIALQHLLGGLYVLRCCSEL